MNNRAQLMGALMVSVVVLTSCGGGSGGTLSTPSTTNREAGGHGASTSTTAQSDTVAIPGKGQQSSQRVVSGSASGTLNGAATVWSEGIECLISNALYGFEFQSEDGSRLVGGGKAGESSWSGNLVAEMADGYSYQIFFMSLNDYAEGLSISGGVLRYEGPANMFDREDDSGNLVDVPVVLEASCD